MKFQNFTMTYVRIGMLGMLTTLAATAAQLNAAESSWPQEGDKARDFALAGLDGKEVTLSSLTEKGSVVLVVLRGYPGYQCPICRRQVGDFAAHADKFAAAGASVVMIYPGAADDLTKHAKEFFPAKLPDNVYALVDPDYEFTKAYGLRWDAPRETAYPSTFVIDGDKQVRFVQVSMSHAGRTKAADVLKKLPATK